MLKLARVAPASGFAPVFGAFFGLAGGISPAERRRNRADLHDSPVFPVAVPGRARLVGRTGIFWKRRERGGRGRGGGQRPTEANAAWWGFDPDDATAAVQAAIDSGAARVRIPYMGRPWIVTPITLRGGLELIFEPGVVLLAKEGLFQGKSDSLFTAANAADIVVRGYGATLRMRKADYQSEAYEKAEWRMCLPFAAAGISTSRSASKAAGRRHLSGGDAGAASVRGRGHPRRYCHDHHRKASA